LSPLGWWLSGLSCGLGTGFALGTLLAWRRAQRYLKASYARENEVRDMLAGANAGWSAALDMLKEAHDYIDRQERPLQ
jgi:O-antigen ligase